MKLIYLTLFSIIITTYCTNICPLEPQIEKLITLSFDPFRKLGGINHDMIMKAAEYSYTCLVTIHNHKIKSKCLPNDLKCFFKPVALTLPDMEFVINLADEPRVFNGNCTSPDQDWRYCACSPDFVKPTLPGHGVFLEKGGWRPHYEKVPVFSPTTIPNCFIDIVIVSYLHVEMTLNFLRKPWK